VLGVGVQVATPPKLACEVFEVPDSETVALPPKEACAESVRGERLKRIMTTTIEESLFFMDSIYYTRFDRFVKLSTRRRLK
jgi:SHS2 domain-containing protein